VEIYQSQQISELKLKIKSDYVVGLFIFFKKGNTVTLKNNADI